MSDSDDRTTGTAEAAKDAPPKAPAKREPAPACEPPGPGRRLLTIAVAAGVAALFAAAVAALLVNIMERQQEGRNPFYRVVALDETIDDPAVWGKNFPQQYDLYLRTSDQVRTRFGGSEAMPRTPTEADPRSVVSQQKLEEDPRLVTMWKGYAFSKDFREERGHAHMLSDQEFTGRQQAVKQPGACLHCHASTWVAYNRLGNGDIMAGFDAINRKPYFEARKEVMRAVSCIDCHDPDTMALRITRPAFLEGIKVLKASQGVADYDPNRDATRQEMRSYVCAQCHVEYYFAGETKRLTFPWHRGNKVEEIYTYYQDVGHKDWEHALTGAPALKAQHPEFEVWSQGIHARSGVACADCHMPYVRVGAMKISDHHVRSPLLNTSRACLTCHHFPEEEMRARVETIQARFVALRDLAMDALMDLIAALSAARDAGHGDAHLARAREMQRRAQFYLDFVEAENSAGFHAPGETLRILGESLNFSRLGQLALRDLPAVPAPPPPPVAAAAP